MTSEPHHRMTLQIQRATIPPTRLPYMSLALGKQAFPDERLAEQQLDILLRPVLGREGLQVDHDALEIHPAQLVRPFHQEGGTDVKVEGGEALVFGLDNEGKLVSG